MQVTTTTLPKSSVELSVELSVEEIQPYLAKAAEALSREHQVKGFRPGKLPYALAVQRFGEQALYHEAAEHAIRDAYVRAVHQEKLKTIGQPHLTLGSLTPNAPVTFTATVAVLPTIELPDVSAITVDHRAVHIDAQDVDRALEDLRKIQPTEVLIDRAVAATDKVIVDIDLTKDKVPLEGGQARGHQIYLTESYYLPRVKEEVVGMQKGEVKTFPLEFPADHFQKHLAGQTVDCTVTLRDVYSVEYAALDDALAQRLGQATMIDLRTLIERNLTEEATRKANDAEEIAMLDAIVAKAKISDLPELLITGEAHRMLDELSSSLSERGLEFTTYLAKIKKTRDQLLMDFVPEAIRRVKVALVTRAVAEHAAVTVSDTEIDTEIQQQLERYAETPEFHQRMQSEEARDYVRMTLRNRKVITHLRGLVAWNDVKPVKT
ncbi:trigger factor [Candidatus Uhrbacteria bacterium]|nr:trigger factor [Candidatus Uhrbacteria bacterium]